MKNTKIVAGFPGTGKSFISNREEELIVNDSDSSNFTKLPNGERNPEFPKNYIEHIKSHIGKVDILFVSTHKEIRDALRENGIHYTLVYPKPELKQEYLDRYEIRGSSEEFIKIMDENWDKFIKEVEEETFPEKYALGEEEYMLNVPELIPMVEA